MSASQDCPFCRIIRLDNVEDFDVVVSILDAHPVTSGHRLIIPRRHVESYFDMTEQEKHAADQAAVALRETLQDSDASITGFNIGINIGESAGQTVRHAHIHFIPRRDADTDSRTLFTRVLTL